MDQAFDGGNVFGENSEASDLLQVWLAMPFSSAVGVSAFGWAAVLLSFWMNPWCSLEFKKLAADRWMSVIHAVVNGALGLAVALYSAPRCTAKMSWTGVPLLLFIGYVLVDLVSMSVCDIWQRWRPVDKPMLFHHVFILVLFSWAYLTDVGVWFGSALLLNELSTPFMNLFWYLQHTGQKNSRSFQLNGTVFLLVFFACRVLYIPFNVYQFYALDFCQESKNLAYHSLAYVQCAGYTGIYILNLMWFNKLVQGALKASRKEPIVDNVPVDEESAQLVTSSTTPPP